MRKCREAVLRLRDLLSVPVCSEETGGSWCPPERAAVCPHHFNTCSRLPVSSSPPLSGHRPQAGPSLQPLWSSPWPSSLVVNEVPPAPDWLALASK